MYWTLGSVCLAESEEGMSNAEYGCCRFYSGEMVNHE